MVSFDVSVSVCAEYLHRFLFSLSCLPCISILFIVPAARKGLLAELSERLGCCIRKQCNIMGHRIACQRHPWTVYKSCPYCVNGRPAGLYLCELLAQHPALLAAFDTVVELGSGTGLTGILVSKILGNTASRVVLTDHNPQVSLCTPSH